MKKTILGKYTLQTPLPEHAKQQAELQAIVFPTLSEEELITEEKYKNFITELESDYFEIPFRVAETPIFVPKALKEKLIAAGEEIVNLIKQPNFKELTQKSIPADWNVPNENAQPHFLTFDFGICKNEAGELTPMLIEMQGFPSLYSLQLESNYLPFVPLANPTFHLRSLFYEC